MPMTYCFGLTQLVGLIGPHVGFGESQLDYQLVCRYLVCVSSFLAMSSLLTSS